jgi:hypothetical protein
MSEAGVGGPAFSARTILALVAVGVVAFAGLAILGAYAPELRGRADPAAHALSASAVGFRGATIMLKAMDVPVLISRTPPKGRRGSDALLVLTPNANTRAKDLQAFSDETPILIVMPKWAAAPDLQRPGFVRKAGVDSWATVRVLTALKAFAPRTEIERRNGVLRTALRAGGSPYAPGTYLPLAPIDQLSTIGGQGWDPALVDAAGRMVLARSHSHPNLFVLAEPDLLNNQGIAHLENARAGMTILQTLSGGGVTFDVTLNGIVRTRSLGRLLLEPPWLAATLCAVAAALLMGVHGVARFGPARRSGRAIALGSRALVDSSAGLVRMARKEAKLAPRYVELSKDRVRRAAGGGRAGATDDDWLGELAQRRGLEGPETFADEAARIRTRDDLLALARRLHRWTREMTT